MNAPSMRSAPSHTATPAEDQELLRRYAEERSEPAFAKLVHRHLDLVYAAALRRLGGDGHAAADVAQQVFTALARQAAALTRGVVLPGWLYATTRNVAVDFIRAEHRRRAREQEAHTMHELTSPPPPDEGWENLRPLLDAAMDELADRDREAVLLRFFARRPFAEIGTTLNLSEDAARMRVERALAKLHALLARRGVTSTSSALAVVLASQAAASAPAGLAASIVGSALSGVAVAGAGSLAAVIAFMSASKITVSLAVVGALATGLAVYQSSHANSAATELAQAQRDRAALAARLTELEKSAAVAGQELAEREAALERARLARAAELAAAARQAAAEEERVKQGRALIHFLANHPGYQSVRLESARANFRSTYGMFLSSIGFTPTQIDRAAEAYDVAKASHYPQLDVRPDPEVAEPALAKFRAWFGDAAAERWAQHVRTGEESQIVATLCAFQFHDSDPFTLQQVNGLTEVLSAANTVKDVPKKVDAKFTLEKYDWDRILREAEPMVSPSQLEGLRVMAGVGKMAAMVSAAKKQSTPTVAK